MKTVLLAACLMISFGAAAQTFIGLKAGPAFTNMTDSRSNKMRVRISGGITLEHFLSERQSIGAELIFNQRGFKQDIQFNQGPNTNDPSGNYDLKYNYNYLSLPLKTSLRFGKNRTMFGSVGLVPSFLLNARQTIPDLKTDPNSFDMTDHVSKFDLAGHVEFGTTFPLNETWSFFGSLACQFGFIPVKHDGTIGTGFKPHSLALLLSAGINRKLTK